MNISATLHCLSKAMKLSGHDSVITLKNGIVEGTYIV